MSKSLKADMMLLLVAMAWGLSYYFVDVTMEELDVFTQNAYRFLIAFTLAFLLSFPRLRHPSKKTIQGSFATGSILFLVYLGATLAVKYTTLSNAAFLGSLMVIFTPIFTTIYFRKNPGMKSWFSVILCVIGVALLTLGDDFHLRPETLLGDIFALSCALTYAHHLLVTEHFVRKDQVDGYQMSVYQFLVCGLLNLIFAFLFEHPTIPQTAHVRFALLFLAVFCSGIAFIVQTSAQKYTPATHVGLIFTLEPVFAAIAAFFLAGERLTPRAYGGAAIMLISILLMEIPFPRKKSLRR